MGDNRKMMDLVGQRFGRWLVLHGGKKPDKPNQRSWVCKCDCGTVKEVSQMTLRSGSSKSCGCLRNETASKLFRLHDHTANITRIYKIYRQEAKKKNREFSLTIEEFEGLTTQNCHYCGQLPSNISRECVNANRVRIHPPFMYNGIDRVDNSIGYCLDNCVPCCRICNMAKRDLSKDQFLGWIKTVYAHSAGKTFEKTIGELVDDLATTNMKCFMAQEDLMKLPPNSEKAMEAAKRIQELNARRNRVMRSIDIRLGFEKDTPTEKTYEEGK